MPYEQIGNKEAKRMTTLEDITIVSDHTGTAGVVTWWRLGGVVDYEKLVAEWKAADFPPCDLPSPPSDAAALRRALEVYRSSNTLIRALPTGGFAVVEESFDAGNDADPEYEVRFKIWFDEQELALSFDRGVDTAEVDTIHDAFVRCRRELHPQDVSSWLVKRCKAIQSIGLRDTGGIYFVPERFTPTWSLIADLLARCSESRIYEIPALKTARAVEAIMEAVINDAAEHLDKLTKALDEKDIGERGLRGRAEKCEAVATKLRLYESLLGRNMEAITARVQEADARITDMILMSEAT